VVAEAERDGPDAFFQRMAVAQSDLYRFLYQAYQDPALTDEAKFGLVVGMYAMLERQLNG
jgi:hypothetical protein